MPRTAWFCGENQGEWGEALGGAKTLGGKGRSGHQGQTRQFGQVGADNAATAGRGIFDVEHGNHSAAGAAVAAEIVGRGSCEGRSCNGRRG
jgi:hypothetical protein